MSLLPREVMRGGLLRIALAATACVVAAAAGADEHFAQVGGTAISAADYDAALRGAARAKFYHRQVPEPQVQEFQREVAWMLIDRALLLAEARRLGLSADPARVAAALARREALYAGYPAWREQREAALPRLRRELEEADLLSQIEATARTVASPSEAELRAFHAARASLFVEPEQVRLSIILLGVDPSSPGEAWQSALAEALALHKRIEGGEDFAALARERSRHASAAIGGDLGYLHRGMIAEPLYAALDGLAPGALSAPIRVLEGVALVRLEARRDARPQPFEEARARAAELWQREQADFRWSALLASLRAGTAIRVDAARYPALDGIAP